MLPATVAPPASAPWPILSEITCAPGAIPSKPARLAMPKPVAMPATWVPWPPSSKCKDTRSSSSSTVAARATGVWFFFGSGWVKANQRGSCR